MKVYVGMSGGVDSSLAAALLVEEGHDVTGVYMKNWTNDLPGMKCAYAEDLADAKRVAVQLGIPFKVFDFQKEYKSLVVDYLVREYQAGRTPNPDIMCNQEIKFGLFLESSLADGAEMIATGHYARVRKNGVNQQRTKCQKSARSAKANPARPANPTASSELAKANRGKNSTASSELAVKAADFGGAQLLRAGDENKDQTYFLYRVNQSALAKTLFPLGDFTSKNQVRQEAEKRSLATAGKKDSQGICFIGTVGIRDFLSQFVETKPGDIIEKDSGRVVGRHDGAIFYTFGQRHGLSVGGGLPYYVVGKDMLKNQVYVSADLNNAEFWRDEIELTDVHWINRPPIEESPATASSNPTASSELAVKTVQIRVRHRAPLKPARLVASSAGSNSTASSELAMADRGKNSTASSELAVVKVKLDEPERAIAPGQSIVIYDGEIVLGGGIVR